MKLYFKKTINGLVPSDSNTKEVFRKVEMGKIVRVTLNVARNYEFHKKAMALVKVGFDNQDSYRDFDMFRASLTIRCEHVDFITVKASRYVIPKSWAFDKMDNIEFEVFYKKLWNVVYNDILGGVERMDLEAAVLAEVREFME